MHAAKPNIILTGFMGTGKTTVGRLLAVLSTRQFVDTDSLIEAQANLTIPEIFAQEGEAGFRQREQAVALALAERSGLVIGSGGGLVLDERNVSALARHGQFFTLVAAPETILARVTADGAQRPLLQTPDPLGRITSLLEARAAAYAQFPQITTDGKSPAEVAAELYAKIVESS